MVAYEYDAWGNVTVSGTLAESIGRVNPLRYRGYYYDEESGFYYLMSRYYDAVTGRFLNADEPLMLGARGTILGYNLFAYCENNAVKMIDPNGYFGTPIQWVCAVIGGVAGWYFGDYIARNLGYVPSGKGFRNAATYWTIRTGVIVGGAVVGWFAGTAIINLAKAYLVTQPNLLLTVIHKLGTAGLGTKVIYDMVKLALFDAGAIVLDRKKCSIAKEAYHRGLYGGGQKWSSSALNEKIKKNTYFKEQLKNAMKNVTGNSVTNKRISLEFTNSRSTDLYLSIGKIDLYVTGTKTNGKWNLKVSGTDVYNFDSFRLTTGFSVGNVANDLGVIMQKGGMMKPYTITVSFSTTC